MAQIYVKCILQCTPYHMTANVLSATELTDYDVVDPFHWKSTLTKCINNMMRDVLAGLAALDGVLEVSIVIATLPKSLNRLGIFSPSHSAVSSFLEPLARFICYAEQGVRLKHTTVTLSPYLCSLFAD